MISMNQEMCQRVGRKIGEKGRTVLTGRAGIDRGYLQTCGSLSTNSVVLGSSRAERQKGEKRGERGLFIGMVQGRNG
jgi:hypothetical protein